MQPLDAQNQAILMSIIEDRHGKHSTLLMAQVPVDKWYEVIGEQIIADLNLYQIINDAPRLALKESNCKK